MPHDPIASPTRSLGEAREPAFHHPEQEAAAASDRLLYRDFAGGHWESGHLEGGHGEMEPAK